MTLHRLAARYADRRRLMAFLGYPSSPAAPRAVLTRVARRESPTPSGPVPHPGSDGERTP